MYFTVEEENLICLYHNADRRRTAANLRARRLPKPLRPAFLYNLCQKSNSIIHLNCISDVFSTTYAILFISCFC